MNEKLVLDSAHGWLVLVDIEMDQLSLFNPSTWEVIIVDAEIEDLPRYNRCVFSKAPSEEGAYIVLTHQSVSLLFVYLFEDQTWFHYRPKHYGQDVVFGLTSYQGKLYGVVDAIYGHREFAKFELNEAGDELEIERLVFDDYFHGNPRGKPCCLLGAPVPKTKDQFNTMNYFAESPDGNELYFVFKYWACYSDFVKFKVSKVNFDTLEVEELDTLPGKTLFLSNTGNAVCRNTVEGISESSVYFTHCSGPFTDPLTDDQLGYATSAFSGALFYVYHMTDNSLSRQMPTPTSGLIRRSRLANGSTWSRPLSFRLFFLLFSMLFKTLTTYFAGIWLFYLNYGLLC